MMKLAEDLKLYEGDGFMGFGKLGLETDQATNADVIFTQFISTAVGIIGLIAIIWFIFILTMGGIGLITSGGDKTATETAKKKITNGLIGLVVTLLGIFVIKFAGYILGIENLLNFPMMFNILGGLQVN